MTIGEKIIALREEKDISQTEMAKILKVNRTTLFRYERDERVPDMDFFVKLAIQFNLSLDEFILNEERQVDIEGVLESDNDESELSELDTITMTNKEDAIIIKKFQTLTTRNKYRIEGKIDDYITEQKADTEASDELAVSKSVG